MGTTYLFHLRVVLVLMMVQSLLHHLRHQRPHISTFASLNHIHHNTYFKNPYVHIQVFHILHHHTTKLLQAFKSFLTRESIVENQQRKLIRYWTHNSAAKINLLQAVQFGSENCFAASTSISAANATSLQPTHFQQRMLILYMQLNFNSESQFHCRQHTFGSER